MSDIKFKMGALEYFDIAKQYGKAVAQELWEKKGHKGEYIGWVMAVPGWVETELSGVFGFNEHEHASQLLKGILSHRSGS